MSIKQTLEFSEWARTNAQTIKGMLISEITRLAKSNGFGFAEKTELATIRNALVELREQVKKLI